MDGFRLGPEATLHLRGGRWCAVFAIAGSRNTILAQLTVSAPA